MALGLYHVESRHFDDSRSRLDPAFPAETRKGVNVVPP